MAGFWWLFLDWAEWMNFKARMGYPVKKIYDDALIYDSAKHDIIMNNNRCF